MSSEYVPNPLDDVNFQWEYHHQQANQWPVPEASIDPWEAFCSQLSSIYQSIEMGALPDAADQLLPLSIWLVENAIPLKLDQDIKEEYNARMARWEYFNHAWLALLERQKSLSATIILTRTTLKHLGTKLVELCNELESRGLVDYQYGIWEDLIIQSIGECLDIQESDSHTSSGLSYATSHDQPIPPFQAAVEAHQSVSTPVEPDPFRSLREEQSSPSQEEQRISQYKERGRNDLYSPIWKMKSHGKRYGWCSYCKPGKWFRFDSPAYNSHLLFSHGVMASTRDRVGQPEQTRVLHDGSGWEGLCVCNKWVALSASWGRNAWFSHASKCEEMKWREDGRRRAAW